jgi:hypothetical protein
MSPFQRVTPTPEQHATMVALAKKAESLYEDISAVVPDSHYKTEALRHLELVAMMANKGITHGEA